jgi:peroxiredoxin
MQLRKLQSSLKEIEATGGQVVTISYDSPETLKRVAKKREVTLLMLSDPGSKTIDAYGIRNQEPKAKAKGLPYPGIFILDRQGIIRAKLFHPGYAERAKVADLIQALNEVP